MSRAIAPRSVTARVHPAGAFFVSLGTNSGDGLGTVEEVCAGDIYQLDPQEPPLRLLLAAEATGSQRIAPGSERGAPGDRVEILARHRLMAPDGEVVDVLLLALLPEAGGGAAEERFVLPLGPLAPGLDYTLIASEAEAGEAPLSDLLCVAFAAGTRILLADGRQARIETLQPGDRLLTRDHGPQPLRWVGRARLRAVGGFAPVVISAGVLGNIGDLIVSPHHRLFLYRPARAAGLPTPELLVQARHLVDGELVFRREGGFVDYHSLVFDRHEIVYAEGIPVESLLVNDATLAALLPPLAEELRARLPGLSQRQHFGTEADRALIDRLGRRRLFRFPAEEALRPRPGPGREG